MADEPKDKRGYVNYTDDAAGRWAARQNEISKGLAQTNNQNGFRQFNAALGAGAATIINIVAGVIDAVTTRRTDPRP